jgi:hypothetical protein
MLRIQPIARATAGGFMARYRKIAVRMWIDDKFRRLSAPFPCAQVLWTYLLSGPHTTNVPGLFAAGESALAEALGWPLDFHESFRKAYPGGLSGSPPQNISDGLSESLFFALKNDPEIARLERVFDAKNALKNAAKGMLRSFRECFAELVSEGMVKADWTARVVWIPRAFDYNIPENPNVVRGWRAHWDEIPECGLKDQAYHEFASKLGDIGPRFLAELEAFRKLSESPTVRASRKPPQKELNVAFGKPEQKNLERALANQEQEQEQDLNTKNHVVQNAPEKIAELSQKTPFDRFWEAFPSGRKTGKGSARKSFDVAVKAKHVDPEAIIAAAAEYASSPLGRGEFVKGPTPWLNGECWQDDRAAWNRVDSRNGSNGTHAQKPAEDFHDLGRKAVQDRAEQDRLRAKIDADWKAKHGDKSVLDVINQHRKKDTIPCTPTEASTGTDRPTEQTGTITD